MSCKSQSVLVCIFNFLLLKLEIEGKNPIPLGMEGTMYELLLWLGQCSVLNCFSVRRYS